MYTIEDYRRFRNRWAVLSLAPLMVAPLLILKGLEQWNQQTADALETMSLDWKPGFFGLVLNVAGVGLLALTFLCLRISWKDHKTVCRMEVRGRLNRRHAHPCKHETTSRSGSL